MKYILILFLTLTSNNVLFARKSTYAVMFDLGSSVISTKNKAGLDSLIYNEVLYPGIKLSLIGYADFIGDTASNMLLSKNRAEAVKAYLIGMGFKEGDLKTVQWKGELAANDTTAKDGIPAHRIVDIVLERANTNDKIKPFVEDISKIKINSIIRLHVFFLEKMHRYRDSSDEKLESLYQFMKKYPTIKVRVEGHICCGNWGRPKEDGYDLDTKTANLSVTRAKAVYDYLIKRGIPAGRMSYAGYAFKDPLYPDEKNQWEKDQNKRVEIRILEK
jgi:outer membrane protein OmpA-like peptidoglycan-associated protein